MINQQIAVLNNSTTIAILRYIIMNLKSEQFCILRAQSGTTNLFDLSSNSAQTRLRSARRTRVKIVEQREEKSWVRFFSHSASVYHYCCFQFQQRVVAEIAPRCLEKIVLLWRAPKIGGHLNGDKEV